MSNFELWPKVEETAFSLAKREFPGQVFSRENGTSCAYNKQYLSHTLAHASDSLLTQVSDTRIHFELLFTRVKGLEKVIVLSTAQYQENACIYAFLSFVPRCFPTHFISNVHYTCSNNTVIFQFYHTVLSQHFTPSDSQNCPSFS